MSVASNSPRRQATLGAACFSSLSPAWMRLVKLITVIHYGRIHRLSIVNGEPVFEPAPLVLRTVKLAGYPEAQHRAIDLRLPIPPEIHQLRSTLKSLGNGTVERIEIARGVPLFVELVAPLPVA